MVICKAEMFSDFRTPYTVVLNEEQDRPGQKDYWVVVINEHNKNVLVSNFTSSEEMAHRIWLEECFSLLDTFRNVREKQFAEIETLSSVAE